MGGKGQEEEDHTDVGQKVIDWINGPYQTWLLGIEERVVDVSSSSQEPCCRIFAKLPKANELCIEINGEMQRWLVQNPDRPSVEVGLNAHKQVTITINCGREFQAFLDLYGSTLPQVVWDHADVVALDVAKRKKIVKRNKIVQAQTSLGMFKTNPAPWLASIGAYFYQQTPKPQHLLTTAFHGHVVQYANVTKCKSPTLNCGPVLFDLNNELQELTGVTVCFDPPDCGAAASGLVPLKQTSVALFASSQPIRSGAELAMIIVPSAVELDCKQSVRLIGEIQPMLCSGPSGDGDKVNKNLLQIKDVRTLLGDSQMIKDGWSGSRVYTRAGLLGFLVAGPDDANIAYISYWDPTNYYDEMKGYVLCRHNDGDQTVIDQLKELMKERSAGYGPRVQLPPPAKPLSQFKQSAKAPAVKLHI